MQIDCRSSNESCLDECWRSVSKPRVIQSREKSRARMSSDSAYSRKVSDEVLIENGIMVGPTVPVVVDHNTYGELILERLRAYPKFVGQVDALSGDEETFGEMTEKSVKCAMWLREMKVEAGDVVAVCTHNQLDMYVPCYASLYVGAVINTWWDSGITKEMAKCFLGIASPKVLFVSEPTASAILEAVDEIGANIKIVIFGGRSKCSSFGDVLASQDRKKVADFRCTKLPSLEDPAAIVLTSGSTGIPKGVVYTHKSLFHNVKCFGSQNITEGVKMLYGPLGWLSGLYCLLWAVVALEKRVVCCEFTEETFLRYVEKYKVTWTVLPNSSAVPLLKYPHMSKYDVSSLKAILLGGSMITEQLQTSVEKLFPATSVYQVYGCTELGGVGVRQMANSPRSSCGVVSENQRLKVIDTETGRTRNPHEIGEACFKSLYMMKGYYRNPEATRKTIDSQELGMGVLCKKQVDSIFSQSGWLHTGDLAYYDEDGNIFFVDRMKEVIKYRGFQVVPAMIEKLLLTHPGIREVAVSSRPHDQDGGHPLAFVAKKPEAQITELEISKMVSDTFPDYMKLRGGVIFMDKLPHTPSGKIARSALNKLATSNDHFVHFG